MEGLGPIILGTLSKRTQTHTLKDGTKRKGPATFPVGERFALVSQMDRSAVSIPSNIAEGYGRATTQDYLHFLRIARGSAYELETQLVLAEDLGLCGRQASKVAATLQEAIRLLQGLIAALERRTER